MKNLYILLFLAIPFALDLNGQSDFGLLSPKQIQELYDVPELPVKNLKKSGLPISVVNSDLKYFPELVSQTGYSCGQVTGISYVFTYEMNCLNDGDASMEKDQYNCMFTYNFLNKGSDILGASYLDSWKIIQEIGNPNMIDYANRTNYTRWLDGYDSYHNGMQNRINEIYSIKLNTEEGILKMKNWLYNHAGESDVGGIACLYAHEGSYDSYLPNGTPEAGKYVLTELSTFPGHAYAIVGYNDEICYDYNNDGQYTNDLDINNDGKINVRDWEIGGFIFYNTYNHSNSDEGKMFCMYKAIAEDPSYGAPFNHLAHVIKIKEDYEPKITLKAKLKHNSRNRIKIMVGASENINDTQAEILRDYHVFNFQGGGYPVLGKNKENEPIEFGLDITHFYNQLNSNDPIKLFLYIIEKDNNNEFASEILDFEILDYQTKTILAEADIVNTELINNDTTILSVNVQLENTNKIKIEGYGLPITRLNEYFEKQLFVNGGTQPYTWELNNQVQYETEILYNLDYIDYDNDIEIEYAGDQNCYKKIDLPFDFPFYEKIISSVYVTSNGTMIFNEDLFMAPYMCFHEDNLSQTAVIVPFGLHSLYIRSSYDYPKYKLTEDYFSVYWSLSQQYLRDTKFNFQVTLHKNGDIDFRYFDIYDEWTTWIGGISNGKNNYTISPLSDDYFIPDSITVRFIRPDEIIDDIEISEDGLISGTPKVSNQTKTISVKVTDYTGAYDVKNYQYITWPTQIKEIKDIGNFELFPNPFYNDLVIKAIDHKMDNIQVFITDILGKELYRHKFEINSSNNTIRIENIANLKPGSYFIFIGNNDIFEVYPVIKR